VFIFVCFDAKMGPCRTEGWDGGHAKCTAVVCGCRYTRRSVFVQADSRALFAVCPDFSAKRQSYSLFFLVIFVITVCQNNGLGSKSRLFPFSFISFSVLY
jgi:hypothetical protein